MKTQDPGRVCQSGFSLRHRTSKICILRDVMGWIVSPPKKKYNEVLTPSTCKWDLIWRAFVNVINLRIWKWYYPGLFRYSLNPMTNVHRRDTQRHSGRASHAKMEAEISYSASFPKIESSEARKVKEPLSPSPWRQHAPIKIFISDIWPPELWE